MKTLCVLIFLLLIGSPAVAQGCQPDLSAAIDQLTQAQTAFSEGNSEAGLAQLSEARQVLALQEATCINYAPETAGDKRSNPVPFGQRKPFELSSGGKASVEVIDYVNNANETSRKAPPEGKRYVLITIIYYCEVSSDEQCDPNLNTFHGVGSKNIRYDAARDYIMFTEYPPTLFGGGQVQIGVPLLVDEDETDIVLIRDNLLSDPVYFATQ